MARHQTIQISLGQTEFKAHSTTAFRRGKHMPVLSMCTLDMSDGDSTDHSPLVDKIQPSFRFQQALRGLCESSQTQAEELIQATFGPHLLIKKGSCDRLLKNTRVNTLYVSGTTHFSPES
jgi:hypothetical protein